MSYVGSYVAAGYQVVQIAWGPSAPGIDWEYTTVSGSSNPPSIRAAACRPASFLNWVRNGGIWAGNGGMCAHGNSAGSAAIAYALAWYDAGAATASNGQGYLDKVVLENGPVFSDIEQGCEISSSGTNNQYTLYVRLSWAGRVCRLESWPRPARCVTGIRTGLRAWSQQLVRQPDAEVRQQFQPDKRTGKYSVVADEHRGHILDPAAELQLFAYGDVRVVVRDGPVRSRSE
jgi:hypothetical protein